MAKMSQTVKEIIKTGIFLVIVGLLVTFYIIYPLTRTKTMMGRTDIDTYQKDSVGVNDPTACTDYELACDTFRVSSDGMTTLAGLYITPEPFDPNTVLGTVILLNADTTTRESMLPWAKQFVDSGYIVILYDQRATGLSTDTYHGEGRYEASDLVSVIGYLDLRDKISHPLAVIGETVGADAGYLASLEEPRIDGVVAINPYLSTTRMWDILKKRHDMLPIPFFRTIMWWWYDIRSGYAAPYRSVDDIEPVAVPTLVFVPSDDLESAEVQKLKAESETDLLEVEADPTDSTVLLEKLFGFVRVIQPHPIEE